MKIILLLCLSLLLLSGCVTRAVYQSPMHTHTNRYKPIPMHNEGSSAATYAGFHTAVGTANEHGQDQAFNFGTSFHRSHNFNHFQATYGANLTVGDYKVNRYHIPDSNRIIVNRDFDAVKINEQAGHKFFGAYGLSGSVNVVVPFRNSEWRVIGTELAWNQEFGKYLQFRKDLPAGSATMVDRKKSYFTWGFFTEILGRVGRQDNSLGYKLSFFGTSRKLYNEWNTTPAGPEYIQPACLSQTLHFTLENKVTIAIQANLGTYAFSSSLSTLVRLDKLAKKKAGHAAGL